MVASKQDNRCPHCDSTSLATIPGKPPHALQVICTTCERHVKWLPSPQAQERHYEYRIRISQLLGKHLRGWDMTFIRNLDLKWKIAERDGKTLKLSPKQIAHLERIEGGNR